MPGMSDEATGGEHEHEHEEMTTHEDQMRPHQMDDKQMDREPKGDDHMGGGQMHHEGS